MGGTGRTARGAGHHLSIADGSEKGNQPAGPGAAALRAWSRIIRLGDPSQELKLRAAIPTEIFIKRHARCLRSRFARFRHRLKRLACMEGDHEPVEGAGSST